MRGYPSLPGEGPPSTSGPSVSQPPYISYNYPPQANGPAYPPWGGPAATPPPPQPSGPRMSSAASIPQDSVSLIRLRINEDFRIDPPIPISPALLSGTVDATPTYPRPGGSGSDLQGGQQANGTGGGAGLAVPSLDREHAMLAQTQAADTVAHFFNTAEATVWQPPSVSQFVDMGFKPAQAALGVAYAKEAKLGDADVPEFASNLSELTGMGYALALAAGALAMRKNDRRAASELCLELPAK